MVSIKKIAEKAGEGAVEGEELGPEGAEAGAALGAVSELGKELKGSAAAEKNERESQEEFYRRMLREMNRNPQSSESNNSPTSSNTHRPNNPPNNSRNSSNEGDDPPAKSGPSLWSRMKNKYGKFKDIMNRPVPGQGLRSFEESPLLWFVIFVLVNNILGYYMPNSIYWYIIYGVVFFFLLPMMFSDGTSWFEKVSNRNYATISAMQLFILWLYKTGPAFNFLMPFYESNAGVIIFLFFVLNAWGFYILFSYSDGSLTMKLLKGLVIAVIILAVVWTSFSMIQKTPLGNVEGNNYGIITFNTAIDSFKNFFQTSFAKFKTFPTTFRNSLNKSIAIATGTYYEGQVEEFKDQPLGVFIQNTRQFDQVLVSGRPITLLADITANSFKGTLQIKTSCVAKSPSGKLYSGKIDVGEKNSDTFLVVLRETRTVFCTFNNLSPGRYDVQIIANFPFQTWAYITYTFADQDLLRAYYSQGANVAEALQIDPNPLAVYTSGPVAIGLKTETQPIPLDRNDDNSRYSFGATIQNRWTNGVIEKVDYFILKTPDPILLKWESCAPEQPEEIPGQPDNGLYNYTFKSLDPKYTFNSITCRMFIPQNKIAQMLGTSSKVQKTFVAEAHYTYTITQTMTIDVKP